MEEETRTDHLPHKSFAEMIDDFDPRIAYDGDFVRQRLIEAVLGPEGEGYTHYSPVGESKPGPDLMPELAAWWRKKAHQDSELVSRKYQEYGNTALLEVGRQLCEVAGIKNPTKAQVQMLGIWFFMTGKMARWKTAILKGVDVSDDTLDDLAIYSFMARRTQEKGGWPDA